MDTNNFDPVERVQRFHLTLVGEARWWYQSIHPFPRNWKELQKKGLGLNFLNQATLESCCFMLGEHFILMRVQKKLMPMCRE